MNILVTGATGMFGGALLKQLAVKPHEHTIKALVRNREKAVKQALNQLTGIELTEGDLTEPETLSPILQGVDRVFLVTPMMPGLDQLEINMIEAAKKEGVKQIFKLYGAVKHEEDEIHAMHLRALDALKKSGIEWTLISPNSVMETSLLPYAGSIKEEQAIYGCTGKHRVGFVALQDVVAAAAIVLTTPGHIGQNYQLTGPAALHLYEVCELLSTSLGKTIRYVDMSEDEFEELICQFTGKTRRQAELEVMCHMRAWNQDGADLVTDTYRKLTGKPPTSLADWIEQHQDLFSQ